jgi:p-cumate 2,3-dioxygenase beta subunit
MTSTAARVLTRAEAEDFLYHEAALLDAWRLEEWLGLFTLDCSYEIPPLGLPDADAGSTYSLIHDHRSMLEQRVIRLKKPTAHAEFPHSRTRRIISNVMITGSEGDEVEVAANFVVYRVRGDVEVRYFGRYEYVLDCTDGIRIRRRKAILDHDVLDPHGKVSIIL